jgi:hypothetical protein
VEAVEQVYKDELPELWQEQYDFMKNVSKDFKFSNSVYSTLTVNRNKRTTYHYDAGDFRGGMGNLIVLEGGEGGGLVLPRYRIAFFPQPGDVLLMNVPGRQKASFREPDISGAIRTSRELARLPFL